MRRRVDVRLARESLAHLQPPPTSILNGQSAACVVRVCCLRRPGGLSRLAVSLPVDEATARRFTRTCRLEAVWARKVRWSVLIVAALGLVPGVIGVVRNDLGLLLVAGLLELGLALATIVGRLVLTLQRSRHHPVLVGRSHVLVRDVDLATARTWAGLNPFGSVAIRG